MADVTTPITDDANPYIYFPFDSSVKTRFIKLVGKGNTGNNANNILEIKFREGK